MALVLGTNCGVLSTAPTSDPEGGFTVVLDGTAKALKITTTDAVTITEMGWYTDNATEESNFEVGIYSHDSGPDEPDTRLFVNNTNAKGTGAGWKVVTGLSWDLDASTIYWLAIQLDQTATTTNLDTQFVSGEKYNDDNSSVTLPVDWTQDITHANRLAAIYALTGAPPGFTRKIKISGTFQDKPIKTKVGGTFVDKPIKIKVGGTFQDA